MTFIPVCIVHFRYCRTGNFHDRDILKICGVGRFTTGRFCEFLNCTGSELFCKNSMKA